MVSSANPLDSPPELVRLLNELQRADALQDWDAVFNTRKSIAEDFPNTLNGAEALYRLGLSFLFQHKEPAIAADYFRKAAVTKIWPWAPSARMSLALLLRAERKYQQAAFELRKIMSSEMESILVAEAHGLLVMILLEQGKREEADRARQAHHLLLKRLIKNEDEETRALAYYQLGMDDWALGNKENARRLLQESLKLKRLPEQETKSIEKILLEK